MGRINLSRVILGGIVAGIVINVSEYVLNVPVLGKDIEAAMVALGKHTPMGSSTLSVWLAYGLVLGIVAVWLYAAIRPRYGAGPGTAIRAGLFIWLVGYFLVGVGNANMGLFPTRMITIAAVWGLFEIVIATLVGAALYKEP
jgi:hypothetical protein